MAIAKGMTNIEWKIHEQASCLQNLLSSAMESIDNMRTSIKESISKQIEMESEGDPEIRHERELYYLGVFDIPDEMEQRFLQSMVVQICIYIESILKDITKNNKQDKGSSKILSFYNHIQTEKNKDFGPITNYIPKWCELHKMRNDIVHDVYIKEHLCQQEIKKTIEEARVFLKTVENA